MSFARPKKCGDCIHFKTSPVGLRSYCVYICKNVKDTDNPCIAGKLKEGVIYDGKLSNISNENS